MPQVWKRLSVHTAIYDQSSSASSHQIFRIPPIHLESCCFVHIGLSQSERLGLYLHFTVLFTNNLYQCRCIQQSPKEGELYSFLFTTILSSRLFFLLDLVFSFMLSLFWLGILLLSSQNSDTISLKPSSNSINEYVIKTIIIFNLWVISYLYMIPLFVVIICSAIISHYILCRNCL